MSVLVKGIEMPRRCGLCPCFHAENPMYCQAMKADAAKKICAPYGDPIPDWCPLTPVQPHGRLIDARALIAKLHDTCLFDYDARAVVYHEIEDMPAIIEAEGEA